MSIEKNINLREMILSPFEYEKFIREKKRTNAAKEYFASVAEEYSKLSRVEQHFFNPYHVTKIIYNEADIIVRYEISYEEDNYITFPSLEPVPSEHALRLTNISSYEKLSQRLILSLNEAKQVKLKSFWSHRLNIDACSLNAREIAMRVIEYIYYNILYFRHYGYSEDGTTVHYCTHLNHHYILGWNLDMERYYATLSFRCRRDILWKVLKFLFTNKSAIVAFNKLKDKRIICNKRPFERSDLPDIPAYKFSFVCDSKIFLRPEYIAIYYSSIGNNISRSVL